MIAHHRLSLLVACAAFLAVNPTQAQCKFADVIGHWTADRTYADSSGNGNDAVAVGRVGFRPGVVNSAFDFGPDHYLEVPSLNGGNGLNPFAITITAWMHEDVFSNTGSLVNLRGGGGGNVGFTLEPQFNLPGNLLWAVHTTPGYQFLSVPYGTVGTTVFVAVTFSAAAQSMKGYVNGELVASLTTTDTTPCVFLPQQFFRMGVNNINFAAFDGFADEIQIYSGALSAESIAFLYANPGATVEIDVADLNGDGAVNAADLAVLLGAWGPCDPRSACSADLDCDGDVDAGDLAVVLGGWTN